MSIGNVRLSRPYRPPFYDQDQDSDPTLVQVITIKANVAARIATALDPSNPLTPAAIHVLTGDRRRRPDARLRPRASGDDTPAHGIPRPLAATR